MQETQYCRVKAANTDELKIYAQRWQSWQTGWIQVVQTVDDEVLVKIVGCVLGSGMPF